MTGDSAWASIAEIGLPIRIRLMAGRWRDARLPAIARALDALVGGCMRPPAVA